MVEVTVEDRATLESWIRATTTEQRLVLRARIILALARGQTNREVAEELSIRPATVSKWRTRFATKGIGGLADAPRSGKPPTYTEEAERRVLSQLDEDPPPGYARWNGPLLAQVLTDVSETQVWRILRRHGISLERRRSWCVSTDPSSTARRRTWWVSTWTRLRTPWSSAWTRSPTSRPWSGPKGGSSCRTAAPSRVSLPATAGTAPPPSSRLWRWPPVW